MSIEDYQRLQAFLARLPSIGTAAELAGATVAVSGPIGLRTVMAGMLSVRGDEEGRDFYFGNWPESWKDYYTREMGEADPIVQEARRRIWPFSWSELWGDRELSDHERNLVQLARRFDWSDGVAVPIHGPAGYLALVAYAGGPIRFGPEERLILQALSYAAHERASTLFGKQGTRPPPKLSKRELQVMEWVARGRTDAQIADILKISATTVHTYVQQAMRKLGVRSRSQAVNELLLHSVLRPLDAQVAKTPPSGG